MTGAGDGVAEQFLEASKGSRGRLAKRLEAAGVSLKPAEWLLLHAGVAVGAGSLVLLLSGGSLAPAC